MNVLLVNGSPHEQGCTDTALQEAGRMLEQAGIRTTRFWIGSEPLAGCSGCGYCARAGKCCHDDRVNVFLDAAKDADGFIFGAPVHFASASASMIAFLDRSFYADHCAGLNRFAFKPGAAIVSARRAGTSAALDELNNTCYMHRCRSSLHDIGTWCTGIRLRRCARMKRACRSCGCSAATWPGC